jgi:hypothetical protein
LHRHLAKEHSRLTLEAWLEEEGITLPRRKMSRSPKKVKPAPRAIGPSEAVFLEPACKLCQMELKSAMNSKRHYLHHFRKIFQVNLCSENLFIPNPKSYINSG